MKKIVSGIIGIFLVLAIVAGAGYALFSSQVTINALTLETADPLLEISFTEPNEGWGSSLSLPSGAFIPLLPGENDWGVFMLRNNSEASEIDPLNFGLTARLTSATGDWNDLKYAIAAVVYEEGHDRNDSSYSTLWQDLADWNSSDVTIPGGLDYGEQKTYIVRFALRETYANGPLAGNSVGNEVAGKQLNDVQFVITGTQE